MTLTRQIIISALEKNEDFLTAEELYFLVREAYPGIGIATVYRTLQLLEELSLVNRVETGDGKARYSMHRDEAQDGDEPRAEVLLVCDRCGKIIRQPEYTRRCEPLLSELAGEVKEAYRFKAGRAVVQIHGLCAGCSEG